MPKLKRYQKSILLPAPDLSGGGSGAPAPWEAPCADIESLGRGWPMKSSIPTNH